MKTSFGDLDIELKGIESEGRATEVGLCLVMEIQVAHGIFESLMEFEGVVLPFEE